jgi:hypothetical protein
MIAGRTYTCCAGSCTSALRRVQNGSAQLRLAEFQEIHFRLKLRKTLKVQVDIASAAEWHGRPTTAAGSHGFTFTVAASIGTGVIFGR